MKTVGLKWQGGVLIELELCAMLASRQQGEHAMDVPIPFGMLMLLTRHEHDTH